MNKILLNNGIINLLYQLLSMGIALIFIPLSIKALGIESFGVYSLSITFLILFNYFNFGIAPSTTRELATAINQNQKDRINSLIVNSSLIMLYIGIFFFLFFFFLSGKISIFFFNGNVQLQDLLELFLNKIAWLSPLVFIIIIQRAILESIQLFKITSFIKMLLNSIIFIAPTILFIKSFSLNDIFDLIFLIYLLASIYQTVYIYMFIVRKYDFIVNLNDQKYLLQVGSYIMLSGFLMAYLSYFDRYYIGYVNADASSLGYYTVCYDTVSRLNIIIWSLIAVLFPSLSIWFANKEFNYIKKYLKVGFKLSFFILLYISSILILFGEEILRLWIDKTFSENATFMFQLLSVGVVFNAISIIPSRALIAFRKEKLLVALLSIESVIFTIILVFSISCFSINGAVYSYVIKSMFQLLLLTYYVNKIYLHYKLNFKNPIFKYIIIVLILSITLMFIGSYYLSTNLKIIYYIFFTILYIMYWNSYIIKSELNLVVQKIKNKVRI